MKTKIIISCFVALATMLVGNVATAQTDLSADKLTSEWTLLSENSGVNFFVRQQSCFIEGVKKDYVYSMVKIENTTSNDLIVNWQLGRLFDDECDGCEFTPENNKSILIPANSSSECDCTFDKTTGSLHELIRNNNLQDGPWKDTRTFKGVRLVEFNIK